MWTSFSPPVKELTYNWDIFDIYKLYVNYILDLDTVCGFEIILCWIFNSMYISIICSFVMCFSCFLLVGWIVQAQVEAAKKGKRRKNRNLAQCIFSLIWMFLYLIPDKKKRKERRSLLSSFRPFGWWAGHCNCSLAKSTNCYILTLFLFGPHIDSIPLKSYQMQVLQINSTFYQLNLSQKNQGAGISQATKPLLNDLSNYF